MATTSIGSTKITFGIVAAAILGLLCSAPLEAQTESPYATIKSIDSDQVIRGEVVGITPSDTQKYCVVVYVHTDRWYIHPFASGGEGKSWATIRKDGTWELETLKREFPADKVAILILEKERNGECVTPTKAQNLNGIGHIGKITIENLVGTDNYKKL